MAREALEETAHAFNPTALVGIYLSRFQRESTGEDVTYLRFAYAGELGAEEPGRALDTGIVRTLWMTPDEIRASADRHRSPLGAAMHGRPPGRAAISHERGHHRRHGIQPLKPVNPRRRHAHAKP